MPVDTQHRDYAATAPKWQRCRDTYNGTDAVKGRASTYLPILEGMDATNGTAYLGYIGRALFYPAMARTVTGLAGLLFAKPPTVLNVPTRNETEFNDVTLTGISLGAYGLDMGIEGLVTGRSGTLIDMPENPAAGARPYWVSYNAEQIVNWSVQRVNGTQMLTRVVLFETVEIAGEDEFTPKIQKRYRVLELKQDGSSDALVYTVTIWTQSSTDEAVFDKGTQRIPLRRGAPLPFIPFSFCNARNITPDVDHPPLVDLADVNLSHYRTSADHEHGAHFTALPTPYITGHKMEAGEKLTIGSGNAWVLSEKATAGMLEFSGAGLGSLSNLKEEKRNLMTSLGARMLEAPRNTSEAAQTVRLRHAGEASAMSVLADAIGQSMTQSVRWHLYWGGLETAATDKITVKLNPEIMEELSAEEITMLVDTWQKKGISKETLYYNLTWGEWTRPGVTFEQEEAAIEQENPPEPEPQPTPPRITQIERDPETGRALRLVQQ